MQETSYIFDFIKDCNNRGKFSGEEICNEALEKIAALDDLFKERVRLSSVLRYFNHRKRVPVPAPVVSINFDSIDKSVALPMVNNLKDQIRVSLQELMKNLENTTGDYKKDCFLAIKQLIEGNVIVRESDGSFVRGDKYNQFTQ